MTNVFGFIKKNAKTISMVTTSVTVFAAAAICANKSLTKVDKIKKEYESNIKDVEEVLSNDSIPEEKYSHEDAENDIRIFKTQKAVKTMTAFLPVIGVFSLGGISSRVLKCPEIFMCAIYGTVAGLLYSDFKLTNKVTNIVRGLSWCSILAPIGFSVIGLTKAGFNRVLRKA